MRAGTDSTRRYRVALFGIALYIVLDAIAQLLPPHYSPISQAESDLAVGPYWYVMTINFLNRGALSLEFLFALVGSLRLSGQNVSRYRAGLGLFGVWSVGAILLAIFPTDVPATPVSWHGAIHLLVAVLAFLGGAFGALLVSARLPKDGELGEVRRFALPVALLAALLCLAELGLPSIAPHFTLRFGGLVERIFLGSVLLWVGSISAFMLRKAGRGPTGTEA